MLDTKTNSSHCACCMASSDGQEWLLRCRRQVAAVSNASNIKAFMTKLQCDTSFSLPLWSCCMLTLPALRPQWSWIDPQMWWTFWSFANILQNTSWHMWPPIKLWKLLLSFCGKVMFNLWSTSQAPAWPRGQLWKQHDWRALQAYGPMECEDFTLPSSNQ